MVVAFDPWTSTAQEASDAHALGDGTALARWSVARQIEQRRAACLDANDGRALMDCMALCMRHALLAPEWLAGEFVRRYDQTASARVKGWSEAFGPAWPPRTRLATERRRLKLELQIYERVWALVSTSRGTRSVNEHLFAQIASDIPGLSPSTAKRYYYGALESRPSVAKMLRPGRGIPKAAALKMGTDPS